MKGRYPHIPRLYYAGYTAADHNQFYSEQVKVLMYAIVEVAGKQYKVEKDMTLNVDRLAKNDGDDIVLEKVLMCVDGEKVLVGEPYLGNVKISAKVIGVVKGQKVRGVKFKKRKNYTRTLGHRTEFSQLKISDVSVM